MFAAWTAVRRLDLSVPCVPAHSGGGSGRGGRPAMTSG